MKVYLEYDPSVGSNVPLSQDWQFYHKFHLYERAEATSDLEIYIYENSLLCKNVGYKIYENIRKQQGPFISSFSVKLYCYLFFWGQFISIVCNSVFYVILFTSQLCSSNSQLCSSNSLLCFSYCPFDHSVSLYRESNIPFHFPK